MPAKKIKRRDLLQSSAFGTAGLALGISSVLSSVFFFISK